MQREQKFPVDGIQETGDLVAITISTSRESAERIVSSVGTPPSLAAPWRHGGLRRPEHLGPAEPSDRPFRLVLDGALGNPRHIEVGYDHSHVVFPAIVQCALDERVASSLRRRPRPASK